MKPDNVTCVQRTRFYFYFFEKKERLPDERQPLDYIVKVRDVKPGALRYFSEFMHKRLARIADMMEILENAHDDWAITGTKNFILMETETFDFNDALRVLNEHGFYDDEFILKVEYTRLWGVL